MAVASHDHNEGLWHHMITMRGVTHTVGRWWEAKGLSGQQDLLPWATCPMGVSMLRVTVGPSGPVLARPGIGRATGSGPGYRACTVPLVVHKGRSPLFAPTSLVSMETGFGGQYDNKTTLRPN